MKKIWYHSLRIKWIPLGTFFSIERCADNGEYIVTVQDNIWTQA